MDEHHLLIRELRPDLLPGRCIWSCKLPKDSQQNTAVTISGRGASSASALATMSTHMTPLKRLMFKGSNIKLAVEVLTKSQENQRPATTSIRLWTQRLTNPYVTVEVIYKLYIYIYKSIMNIEFCDFIPILFVLRFMYLYRVNL